MPIKDYEIVGSYNNQRVLEIDAERSVNLFEYIDPRAKKSKILLSTSGLNDTGLDFGPTTTGGFRASFVFGDNMYHVIGNTFWLVETIGSALTPVQENTTTLLTTMAGYVGVDANTFQMIIVDGHFGYIYDTINNKFVQITDPAFPTQPVDVCYLDGFFVVADGGTNGFQLSSYNQGLIWGPSSNTFTTAFGTSIIQFIIAGGVGSYQTGTPVTVSNSGGALPTTSPQIVAGTTYYAIAIDATHIGLAASLADATNQFPVYITISNDGSGTNTITNGGQLQEGFITSHPGNIIACRTLHRKLFLFSDYYTEVWENAGIGTNLPFRRNNSLLMEYGTIGPGSVAVGFDIMGFLSNNRDGLGPVMMVSGTEAVPISTKALDFQLSIYNSTTGVTDCRSFFLRENGLTFYRMNFTSSNHTFVYNVSMSDPSQEVSRLWHEEEMFGALRHIAQTHAYYKGVNYVGNYLTDILYVIAANFYDNDGELIKRMRIGKPMGPPGYQRTRVDRFQIDLIQGSNQNFILDNDPILLEDGINDLLLEDGDFLETNQTYAQNLVLNPMLALSISKDGGQTYGNVLQIPMGGIGDRKYRSLRRKLGVIPRGQAFVPKIEFILPIPFAILGAAWAFEILPE